MEVEDRESMSALEQHTAVEQSERILYIIWDNAS